MAENIRKLMLQDLKSVLDTNVSELHTITILYKKVDPRDTDIATYPLCHIVDIGDEYTHLPQKTRQVRTVFHLRIYSLDLTWEQLEDLLFKIRNSIEFLKSNKATLTINEQNVVTSEEHPVTLVIFECQFNYLLNNLG